MIPKTPGAQRELLFADLNDIPNIIPIIDDGETDNDLVLIMPRAEISLRRHLIETNGLLDFSEAITILSDIAVALEGLNGNVVHRDLKPENILRLNGKWCLADFGISRYAEATTASDTRKYAFSPPYAAPERWRDERASAATDVYSFGVIAFELLSGSLPFVGPESCDFREQHLHGDPRPLKSVPTTLEALITECLYKTPKARPNVNGLLSRLKQIGDPTTSGLALLHEAHRAEVARSEERQRRESENRSKADQRTALVRSGTDSFAKISKTIKETIMNAAPSITLQARQDSGWVIRLNNAWMTLSTTRETSPTPWGSQSCPKLEVLVHASIGITIPIGYDGYEGRSHSLWYCDAQEKDQYQWFETSFMHSPILCRSSSQDPFALDPGIKVAKALGAGTSELQVAWPFSLLIAGDLDEFVDRWAEWFAEAAQDQLRHPSTMPERDPSGSWRSS